MASKIEPEPEFDKFLKRIRLNGYRESILNLNVLTVEDLQDIDEQELKDMGMSPLEIRRFTREVRKELNLVSNIIIVFTRLPNYLIRNTCELIFEIACGLIKDIN